MELKKSSKLLETSLIEDAVTIPNDTTISFEDSDFSRFKNDQERNKPLKMFYREDEKTAKIQLVGVCHAVKESKKATRNFVEIQREKESEIIWKISDNKSQFLQRYLSEQVKEIENDFKVKMEIKYLPHTCIIRWKGIPETVDKCRERLEEWNKGILEIEELVELPGVQQLLTGKDGLKQLKLIQQAKKVYIHEIEDFSQQRMNISHPDAQQNTTKEEPAGTSPIKVIMGPKESMQQVIISSKNGCIENNAVSYVIQVLMRAMMLRDCAIFSTLLNSIT